MTERRVQRLNSLLKEVLSEVIRLNVKNPKVPELWTLTRVEITNDLRHAKVYVSIVGDENEKKEAIKTLQSASGFISVQASKKVTLRFFPELKFLHDDALENQLRIEERIAEIQRERSEREADAHE